MITINYNKLIEDLLPVLHKTKTILYNNLYQFLISCIKPIKTLYDDFKSYRKETLFDVNHTGQVISLEHYLNTRFALPYPINKQQSVWIEDGATNTYAYLFIEGDDWNNKGLNTNPVYLDVSPQFYIYQDNEPDEFSSVDFIVNYPDTFDTNDVNYLISVINKYKIAGFSYTIKSYVPSGNIIPGDPYATL